MPLTPVFVEEEGGEEEAPGCLQSGGTVGEVVAVEVEAAVVVVCHPWFSHQGQRIVQCWQTTLPSRWVRWRGLSLKESLDFFTSA